MNQLGKHEAYWIGVDIGKASFDAALAPLDAVPAAWAKLPVMQFTMDPAGIAAFEAWRAQAAGTCVGVCIESTGIYSWQFVELAKKLALPEMAMVNPALPRAFGKSFGLRDKCDRVDAAVLALYGVVHKPKANTKRCRIYAKLRTLWRLYEDYAEDVARWENRLEQSMDADVKREIRRTIKHLSRAHQRAWERIEDFIAEEDTLRQDAKLMCSIPSVGMKTAVLILAEFGDLRTWKRKQLISYAGLYPKVYSSGTSVNRKPTLARGGGKRIRKGLFLPACSATRYNKPLAQWREQLLERGLSKMASIAAVMRKMLTLIRAVVLSGQPYDPERLKQKIA